MWYVHTECTGCGHTEAFPDEHKRRKNSRVQSMEFSAPLECDCPDETMLKVVDCTYEASD